MHKLQLTIGEIVEPGQPASVPLDATVEEGLKRLRAAHPTCLLVMDGERLAGIFTRKDAMVRVACANIDPAATAMSEVMTPDPETLTLSHRVIWAINRMVSGGYRNIPVIDESGTPVAVLGVSQVTAQLDEMFEELALPLVDTEESPWVDIGGGA